MSPQPVPFCPADLGDLGRLLSVLHRPQAALVQAARQLLEDEQAPLRRRLLADLLSTVSENIAAETRSQDPPWFEGAGSFSVPTALLRSASRSAVGLRGTSGGVGFSRALGNPLPCCPRCWFRVTSPAVGSGVPGDTGLPMEWRAQSPVPPSPVGLESRFQSKAAYLRYSCASRLRSYLREVSPPRPASPPETLWAVTSPGLEAGTGPELDKVQTGVWVPGC